MCERSTGQPDHIPAPEDQPSLDIDNAWEDIDTPPTFFNEVKSDKIEFYNLLNDDTNFGGYYLKFEDAKLMVTTQQRQLAVFDELCDDRSCIGTVKESYERKEDEALYHGYFVEMYQWDTKDHVVPNRVHGETYMLNHNWSILGGDSAASDFWVLQVKSVESPF